MGSGRKDETVKHQHALMGAALTALTAGLSHEIRNPLNNALLQLEVLERRLAKVGGNRAELLEVLKQVRRELLRLDGLMDEFAGLETPGPFEPLLLALRPLLDEVVAQLRAESARRGLALEASCDEQAIVRGDEAQLQRVFTHLCSTALDHTPKGGSVLISCDDRGVAIEVHVDGGHPTRPVPPLDTLGVLAGHPGAGALNLPIHNAIIARHGGAIAIGTSPRGGVRVSVTLPGYARKPEGGAGAAGGGDAGRRA